MNIELSDQAEANLEFLVRDGKSAQQIVEEAIAEKLFREQREIEAIQAGFDDLEAGRVFTRDEIDQEIRRRFGFSTPS